MAKEKNAAQALAIQTFHEASSAWLVLPRGFDGADYLPLTVDGDGHLQVDILSGGGGGNAEKTHEASFAPASDVGNLVMAVRNTGAATTLNSVDQGFGVIAVDAKGRVITGSEAVLLSTSAAGDMVTQVAGITNISQTTVAAADFRHIEFAVDWVGRQMVTGSSGMTALKVDGSAVTQPVSSTTLATAANQSTANGLLTTIDSDTGTMAGLLATIDSDTGTLASTVAGSEMQVDIVGSLPAGTNAIGKLAANSGVDIGDVDVLSLPWPDLTEASYLTPNTVANAAMTDTSYHQLIDNSASSQPMRLVSIINKTDVVVKVSFDGGSTTHAYLAGDHHREWTFGQFGMKETGSVYIGAASNLPNRGTVYGDAVY